MSDDRHVLNRIGRNDVLELDMKELLITNPLQNTVTDETSFNILIFEPHLDRLFQVVEMLFRCLSLWRFHCIHGFLVPA